MALFQLLDNAARYGAPSASIAINVQQEQAETVISIRNEGSFIPHEEREKVFKRFYRSPGSARMSSGTGIGLSVVKRITEAHQGRVWVDSDQQTGTTFYLTLPRTAKEM
jgi:two-component system sensor histidine kinase KdpD